MPIPELSEKAEETVKAANRRADEEHNEDLRVGEGCLEEWKEAFKLFDKDGNGVIDRAELITVLRSLGHNPTPQEITDMIQAADFTKDGVVDFDEFVVMMINQNRQCCKSEDEMRAAFKVFDKNGDGYVNANELRQVMKTLGEVMTDEEIDEMIKEADIDGDNRINYDEFSKVMCTKL